MIASLYEGGLGGFGRSGKIANPSENATPDNIHLEEGTMYGVIAAIDFDGPVDVHRVSGINLRASRYEDLSP